MPAVDCRPINPQQVIPPPTKVAGPVPIPERVSETAFGVAILVRNLQTPSCLDDQVISLFFAKKALTISFSRTAFTPAIPPAPFARPSLARPASGGSSRDHHQTLAPPSESHPARVRSP